MILDATVLTAFLSGHPQRPLLASKLQTAPKRETTADAVSAASVKLSSELQVPHERAFDALRSFLNECNIHLLPVGVSEHKTAAGLRDEIDMQDITDLIIVVLARKYRSPVLTLNPDYARTGVTMA